MKTYFIACPLLLFSLSDALGTHLRSGSIGVRRAGDHPSLMCQLTITVFTNTSNTPVLFGGDMDISYLEFGDGQRVFVPETQNTIRYDLDPFGKIASATFTVTHTYAAPGVYLVSYREPNRNAGILNADNTVASVFYLDTYFVLDEKFESTPLRLAPPIFTGITNNPFSTSLAATGTSPDESYYYELRDPRSDYHTALPKLSNP